MSQNKTETEALDEKLAKSPFDGPVLSGTPSDPELNEKIVDTIAKFAAMADAEEAARAPRSTREMESRDVQAGELESWQPAGLLPDPPQRAGWVHRWVRASIRNTLDATNMARAMREGWRPAPADEYPEVTSQLFYQGDNPSVIEFGGLVLCRMTESLARARQEYHDKLNNAQMQSVNEKLGNEDPRLRFRNVTRSETKRSPY